MLLGEFLHSTVPPTKSPNTWTWTHSTLSTRKRVTVRATVLFFFFQLSIWTPIINFRVHQPLVFKYVKERRILVSQNTTVSILFSLLLDWRHVSALVLAYLQVTRYIRRRTIQCELQNMVYNITYYNIIIICILYIILYIHIIYIIIILYTIILYAIFYDSYYIVLLLIYLVKWRWPSTRAETCRQPK